MNLISENNQYVLYTIQIGMLGVNCTFFIDKKTNECIIIDAGDDFKTLKNTIDQLKCKVTLFLYTHAHFDHIGAINYLYNEYPQTPFALHENDLKLYNALEEQGRLFNIPTQKGPSLNYLFNEKTLSELSFKIPLLKHFTPLHTPGHTQGGCCFYTEVTETPVLIAGDTLFKGDIGRTDLPGGNYQQILESIKNKLFTLPDETLVITGHGPSTTISYEKKYNSYLK